MEHTTPPASLPNEINSGTDQSNNTTLEKRSCFTTLNKWCRDVYQRVRYSHAGNGQQSEETGHHQQIELDQMGVNAIETPQENKAIADHKHRASPKHLFPLERPYQTIQVAEKTSLSMACSKKHILIEQRSNLCLLDRTLTVVKQIPWPYGHVNICWSSALDRFVLVTNKDIFTLDENTMILQECSIPHHNKKDWSCAACSDTRLYLSTMDMSPSLYEYTLCPSLEFVKEWQLFVICPIYESILTFSYGNERLALVISNSQAFLNRLDLHSSITFEVLWSIPLGMLVRCCPINNDQWIMVNYLESQILHISFDGKILQDYKDKSSSRNPITNAVQWDNDTIITATMKDINLHKLPQKQLMP